MGFFDSIGKIAKAVVKSPITKAVAGATTIVFPPAGAAMVAGIAVANKAVDLADSASPKAPAAKQIVAATLAQGGPPAQAVRLLQAAKQGNMQATAQVRTLVSRGVNEMARAPVTAGAADKIKNVVANESYKKARSLNALVLAFNSKDPQKRKAVAAEVAALRRSRSPKDRAKLRSLRRRTAAIKTARKFFVDSRGLVKKKAAVKVGADAPSPRASHPPLPKVKHIPERRCWVVRGVGRRLRARVGADMPAPHAVTWWVELVRPQYPGNAPYWRIPFRASGFDALRRAASTKNWLYRWDGMKWARV